MYKYYYGSSEKIKDVKRNQYLNCNKEKLAKIFGLIILNENFNEGRQKYLQSRINKVRKSSSNTLTEKDIRMIISFFHQYLDINIQIEKEGDLLVDYMYELSDEFHNKYSKELDLNYTNGEAISLNDKNNKETNINILPQKINAGTKLHRNYLLPGKIIRQSNFMCEIDRNHLYFTSNTTNENYVEAHHLIPLSFQKDFDISLDIIENMASLCIVCHKKIHLATFSEKLEIINELFDLKKDGLILQGINISREKLTSYYQGILFETEEE